MFPNELHATCLESSRKLKKATTANFLFVVRNATRARLRQPRLFAFKFEGAITYS